VAPSFDAVLNTERDSPLWHSNSLRTGNNIKVYLVSHSLCFRMARPTVCAGEQFVKKLRAKNANFLSSTIAEQTDLKSQFNPS
jgi:hypothetical protein